MNMDIFELILDIFGFIAFSLLPSIFKNNLWDKSVPTSLEEFNKEYEDKINKILKENLRKSSYLLEEIINNKVNSEEQLSEEESVEYTNVLGLHEELLIKIKKHVEIESKITDIEILYSKINDIIKDIKNISYISILCILILFINLFIPNILNLNLPAYCALYSIILYCIFRIIRLYYKFKGFMDKLVNYKNWILNTTKSIKRLSDDNGN